MDKFTIFSLWKCFYIAKKKQQVLEVHILPLDALQTVQIYFVEHRHYCPSKGVSAQVIHTISNTKVYLE